MLHEKNVAQRHMVCALGIIIVPSGVAACSFLGLNDAAALLSDMANMYFLSDGRCSQCVLWQSSLRREKQMIELAFVFLIGYFIGKLSR